MAVTWLAVGKLVLANLDTIVGVAKPLFTRGKAGSLPSRADLVNQQIAELQAASSGNAEQIKELAAQLKQVVGALEKTQKLLIAAISISVVSLIAVIVLLFAR